MPQRVPMALLIPTTAFTTAEPHAGPAPVLVRVLESEAEYRSCVTLQRQIWGTTYDEIVPASLLRAAQRVGALVLGAFDGAGELVGFVFGLTGVQGGEVVHWSHMLGVLPRARDHGIGTRLKESQRAELARRGIGRMHWTFDPLQSRNAHLNINKLGARVIEYVEDMYGASRSPLHAAGTDRAVVACATSPDPIPPRAVSDVAPDTPLLTPFPAPVEPPARVLPRAVLIEIPSDLQEAVDTSTAWRAATRRYFQWALQHGYTAVQVRRETKVGRVFYVMERAVSG